MGELVIMPDKSLEELQILNPYKELKSYLIPAVMLDTDNFEILIELIQGTIVIDIETANMVKIVGPSDMTAAEFNVLKQGMQFEWFNTSNIQIGLSEFRLRNILDNMCKKDLLLYQDRKYKVCPGFLFQFYPEKFAIQKELVEISDIKALKAKELPANISVDDAKQKIGNFISINKTFPCYILHHYMEK
ncbi:MAG: hypothetical protein KAT43_06770 [Nanoarchaeota archaeon]|nr:hypothetical protein [Nanoarchaeota archaeon]